MKIAFICLSWMASCYFFVTLHMIAGLPPKDILSDGVFIYVFLFAFFLLLPFAQTLEIGTFFKYSAKLNDLKSEVKDFKEETRNLIALQNSLVTNMSQSVSHNVSITVPSLTQGRAAEEQLAALEDNQSPLGNIKTNHDSAITNYIHSAGGDINFALMRLRRDLEVELRRALDKEVSFRNNESFERPRMLSLRSLWAKFVTIFPSEKQSEQAFIFAVDVCNAAVHGQDVPPEVAEEALSLGLRVLDLVRNVDRSISDPLP